MLDYQPKLTRSLLLGSAATAMIAFNPGVAIAQDTQISASDSRSSDLEIIVTARKRQESLQDVPVVVTAFGAEALERNAVDGLEDLAQITPGLLTYTGGNSAAQGAISLRGIQTGSINLASDQAVALNIDGVQIDSGLALKAGMFDLQQVEVLKGPQALYFGKNSSGGVIALTTADPTDQLFVRARGGYEFYAREKYGELVVSGPLSDTLGARAAVSYSAMDGYFRNLSATAFDDRAPNSKDLIARGTIKWEPSSQFSARIKLNYAHNSSDRYAYMQKVGCFRPGQTSAECEPDRNLSQSAPIDVLNRYEPDEPYAKSDLYLASATLNYKISDTLTLTSTTGYFKFKQEFFDSLLPRAATDMIGGQFNEILNLEKDRARTFSQELRLSSDFDGPLNFMVGGFLDDRMIQSDVTLQFGATANPRNVQRVDSRAYSFFGQLSYDILSNLELTGGARYTSENRRYKGRLLEAVGPLPIGTPLVPLDDHMRETNVSPEATLTWRPSRDVTLYGAYKEGFKSGSFDISSTTNLGLLSRPFDIVFDSEKAEGFEFGFKTMSFDRQLRINGAIYRYKYSGLQLNSFDPQTSSTRVINAVTAITRGAEIEAQFAPRALEGLVVNAALIYNRARYGEFLTDCNQAQLTTGTCPLDLRAPFGVNDSQNMEGSPLRTAPNWTANWGFSLNRPLTEKMNFRVGTNFNYTGRYQTEERNDPLGIEEAYVLLNANLGIASANGAWSLDLLGTNLTNELVKKTSNSQPLTGGAGYRQDFFAAIAYGRRVRLQLTVQM